MNHPLPKSSGTPVMAYEFVASPAETMQTEAGALQPTPVDSRAAETTSRLRSQLAVQPESDDPYEAYRQRILQTQAERVEHVRRTMPPLPSQPLSSESLDRLRQRDYIYDPQQYYSRSIDAMPAIPPAEPFFPASIWNRGVAMACIVAVAAGATVGLALTKKEDIGRSATRTLAYLGTMLPADQPVKPSTVSSAPGTTTIQKKPIATATLDVGDVTGSLNTAIALPLHADPASADQDLSIRITGLPEDAVLTPGRKLADQTWILKDDDLAHAKVVIPHADTPVLDLSVAAIETSTGELAAPVREMKLALNNVPASVAPSPSMPSNQSVMTQMPAPALVQAAATPLAAAEVKITPANAAPETQGSLPQPPPVASVASPIPEASAPTVVVPAPSPVAAGLLQKGDVLFKAGDLMMARQFYLRANDLGAPQGALGVARTYDPAVFKELKVEGLVPDAAQAHEWYRKASMTGLPEAVSALARFETTAALP